MAKEIGSNSTVEVDDNSGFTSATAIGCVTSITFDRTLNPVDSTDNDSGGDKEYLPGDRDSTFGLTVRYDPANSGQSELLTAYNASSQTVYLRYRPTVGTGKPQWTCNALITNISVPSDHETTIDMTVDFQVTAGWTQSNQT